jgi:hypothetical protein
MQFLDISSLRQYPELFIFKKLQKKNMHILINVMNVF